MLGGSRHQALGLVLLCACVATAAATACVENPRHPFDAEMDMGEPGWVDLGACKRCNEAGGDACAECYDAFGVAANGTCVRCADPRCARCDGSEDNCTDCSFDWEGSYETGAFPAQDGTCNECPAPSCAACEGPAGTCTACQRGHGLVKGECKRCGDANCMECNGNNEKKCNDCYSRWFPGTNGKCARCPEGCEECEDEKTCLRCASNEEASERGLRLDDDTFTCQLCAEGCQSCDGPQACNFCIEGWTNGTSAEEQCVKCTDERCTTCAAGEPDRCLICATFDDSGRLRWGADRANGGGCVECRVEHCASCQADADACDYCVEGFWLDPKEPGACQACSLPNCRTCAVDGATGEQVCTGCNEGFHQDYDVNGFGKCISDK